MALTKYKVLSICCASVLILLILEYTTGIALFETLPHPLHWGSDKPCVILHYTNFYRSQWMDGATKTGDFFYPAKERSCVITSKRDYLPRIQDYDALIFFQWNINGSETFPPPETRSPGQLYIIHYLESPQRSINRTVLGNNSHRFNMTMSYRLDADIVWAYGRMLDKTTLEQIAPSPSPVHWKNVNTNYKVPDATRKMLASKKKMISWVVSNCADDPSERMKVVLSLQKFVPVDIYGKCGIACDNCKAALGRDYFFYLAFENSLATDYISEKSYSMMGNGLIPVVYGGADYTKHLPPKSYINAQDFNSTKDLAEFLVKLSGDKEEYLSYFWWQDHYTISSANGYADLCGKVKAFRKNIGVKVQFYEDLVQWEHKDTWKNRTIQLS